jgi:hypothetical protein
MAFTAATSGSARATCSARRTSASMSRPGSGRTWIVTSRETCDCHSAAELRISTTPPRASEARKLMMAITEISARPTTEFDGTIDSTRCGGASSCGFVRPRTGTVLGGAIGGESA